VSDRLEGTTWVLDAASIASFGLEDPPTDARVDLRFAEGSASGRAACNSYQGGYEVDGERLTFSAFAVTEMACDPPLMELESAYLRALAAVSSFDVTNADSLFLTGAKGTLTFVREPPPQPLPLTGTRWVLDTIGHGDAVSSVLGGTRVEVTFGDAGRVSGTTGCNRFRGTYEHEGAGLTFANPLAYTRMTCAERGVMEQEREVAERIYLTRAYVIEGDRLTLSGKSDELLLSFTGS
jgi:heat shock protein HslJ